MSDFAAQRAVIVAALKAAGVHAFTTVPDKWVPPGAFVGPGDPYVTRQGVFANGGEIVNHQVSLVVARGTNDKRADELDALILKTLDVLDGLAEQGFGVGDVRQPGEISINGQKHLAVGIEVAIEINRHHPS